MIPIIETLNTTLGRLIILVIITIITKKNIIYGLLAVLIFILLRENTRNLIEGQKNMKDSNGPTKEEIDAFNKEINKSLNSKEAEKTCEKIEGEPDMEALDIYKKSMFNGSNSINAFEFIARLFAQNNPYYKHYEKKHGSTKLIDDTFGGITSGCYDGYALKVSLEQPKSVVDDDSLEATGSAVSGLLSGF